MPYGRVLQPDPQVVCSDQACWDASAESRRDAKLGRSPGWNLVRAERSKLCVYAFVEKRSTDQDVNQRTDQINTLDNSKSLRSVSSVKRVDEYSRSPVEMELDLAPGESRGYWKYHTPKKWFKQAKAVGKINNEKATLLFDSGAEVSIIDTTFARKVGCLIDESQTQECVGIGENVYKTEGRTKIKITLNGSLVYYFNAWVGDQVGQEAILGMDFMVPAGIRLDLADGTLCLPDEVRIHLSGRRPAYGSNMRPIMTDDQCGTIPVGGSADVRIGLSPPKSKIWVKRSDKWVPTVTTGPGRIKYIVLTNVCDKEVILNRGVQVGWWMANDMVPRSPGYVSVGSRRYNEWQTLAFEATTDQAEEVAEEYTGPLVDHPSYPIPTKILTRTKKEESEAVTGSTKLRVGSEVNEVGGDAVQEEWDDPDIEVDKCEPSKEAPAIIHLVKSESKTDRDRAKENDLETTKEMIPVQEVVGILGKLPFTITIAEICMRKTWINTWQCYLKWRPRRTKSPLMTSKLVIRGSHCQMIRSVCDN